MNNPAETASAKIIRFITTYCRIPEGSQIGQPMILAEFQIKFIKRHLTIPV